MMSPKQHIKTLVASVVRNFSGSHRRVVKVGSLYEKFPPTPYFYGADPDNIKNAVKNFARDIGPQSIWMYITIPSRDILSPKPKYCTGFDV